jgi:hypothetical protein
MKTPSSFVAIAFALFSFLNTTTFADFDSDALISSIDEFLIHQTEIFDSCRPSVQPPLVQTFAWDPKSHLPFPPEDLNPPPCTCLPPCAPSPLKEMVFRGDIYDQSLAACWFIERARLNFANGEDFNANLNRAKKLLDAVILLEAYDPCGDGRVRNAYWANNLVGTTSSIMDPSVGIGNMSYFGIALTRFYDLAEQTGYLDPTARRQYLDIAKEKADWILFHCKDSRGCGGFTGGYDGWDQIPFKWKSTEHNIDVFVFAKNLFVLDGDPKWADMAEHAGNFVRCMFVDVDSERGYYLTGTSDDGITPNPSPIPADAQAWTALARSGNLKIDTDERARRAMRWLLENLKDACCSGYVLPDKGVKFSSAGKNMQCEVTASAAFALLRLNFESSQAQSFIELLDWIRLNSGRNDDGIAPGIGIVATLCPEGAWTGYGPDAWYYKLCHVASSAWTGLMVMASQGHEMANPLRPLSVPEPGPVNELVRISTGLVSYDRRTGQYSTLITIKNTSTTEIGQPVWLVIESISNPAVTLAGADGTTADGKPYFDLSSLLGDGKLNPNESISKRIYFNNPNRLKFTFTRSVRGVVEEEEEPPS